MFEFRLPDLGEGIHEGELLKWYVKKGDKIKEDDPLCDMETDKAAVTIPSPRTGIIIQLNGEPGDTIRVGDILVKIESDSKPEKEKVKPGTTKPRVVAAPATRKMAREMNIDIYKVTGTGPGGRITKEDLQVFSSVPKPDSGDETPVVKTILESTNKPGTQALTGIPFLEIAFLPDYEALGKVEKSPIRSLRKKVATKTASSMILIPHVAHMEECDVTDLDAMRKTFNQDHPDLGRLTLLSFVIKTISSLLKTYPEFNASLDPRKMEIIYKKFYNIGFAAQTPRGLIMPVIKDADQKNILVIADTLKNLSEKGQNATITPPELSNGTFSVTNVGAIGGTGLIPTINYPESAILGMGRVQKKPVVREDEIVIRKILPVTLCFDHRVTDGVQAALFVNDLKLMLEDKLMFMTMV